MIVRCQPYCPVVWLFSVNKQKKVYRMISMFSCFLSPTLHLEELYDLHPLTMYRVGQYYQINFRYKKKMHIKDCYHACIL